MSDKLEFEHPEDELHAYADGELSSDQAMLFERRLASDAKLREQLQTIQRLTSDLRGAFKDEIEAFESRSEASQLSASSDRLYKTESATTAERPSIESTRTASPGTRSGFVGFAHAASLVLGLLLGALSLHLFRDAPQPVSWLTQMASYQAMYTSDTLRNVVPDKEGSEQKLEILVSQLGSRFDVPDLEQNGVEFRRGQTLTSYGEPVIQLAYLTKAGQQPVAVCLTPVRDQKDKSGAVNSGTDRTIQSGNFDDLNYVHWIQGEVEIAIMARLSDAQLRELQKTVRQQIHSGA